MSASAFDVQQVSGPRRCISADHTFVANLLRAIFGLTSTRVLGWYGRSFASIYRLHAGENSRSALKAELAIILSHRNNTITGVALVLCTRNLAIAILECQSAPKFDPPYCLTWGCYFRLTDVGPTVGRSEVASLLAGSEGLETSRSAHHTQRRPRSRDRRPVPHPQPCAG